MERNSEEGSAPDEEDGDQAASCFMVRGESEDEEVEGTPVVMSKPVMSEGETGLLEPERDAPSVSPSSFTDTCGPSLSSLSPSSSFLANHHHNIFPSSSSSSSSSVLCLTPPLPPSVDLSAVLTDIKLTLDLYWGGSAALPLLWGSIPGHLEGLQYLRLGSEDKSSLDDALDVLPNLKELRSLAIRGIFLIYLLFINFILLALNSLVYIVFIVLLLSP